MYFFGTLAHSVVFTIALKTEPWQWTLKENTQTSYLTLPDSELYLDYKQRIEKAIDHVFYNELEQVLSGPSNEDNSGAKNEGNSGTNNEGNSGANNEGNSGTNNEGASTSNQDRKKRETNSKLEALQSAYIRAQVVKFYAGNNIPMVSFSNDVPNCIDCPKNWYSYNKQNIPLFRNERPTTTLPPPSCLKSDLDELVPDDLITTNETVNEIISSGHVIEYKCEGEHEVSLNFLYHTTFDLLHSHKA